MPLNNTRGSTLIENIVSLCLLTLFSVLLMGIFSSGITAFGEMRELHQTISENYLEIETDDNLSINTNSGTVLKLDDGMEIQGAYVYSSNGLLGEFKRTS